MNLNLKINATDAVNAKFLNTLKVLNGYLQEAKGDMSTGQNYSANAVHSRLLNLETAFKNDLATLAKDINVNETIGESN